MYHSLMYIRPEKTNQYQYYMLFLIQTYEMYISFVVKHMIWYLVDPDGGFPKASR